MTGTDITYAAALIQQGKLVAIPTETVYGLAANALNTDAVLKIFETKNRPKFNPLIVHIDRVESLDKYVEYIHPELRMLAEHFWPGPLTILCRKKENLHDIVTAGSAFVAIRIPNHPFTLELLQKTGLPLAAPSANPFGYISPTEAQHVEIQLKEKVDYILDGGTCSIGLESTIIQMQNNNEIEILRQGAITPEDLQLLTDKKIIVADTQDKIQAPGMTKSHYAPSKKLIIGNIDNLLLSDIGQKIGVLSFQKRFISDKIIHQEILSKSGDLREAAKNLFSAMHRLDAGAADIILTEPFPNEGIGAAMNDKITRAAHR
ncbi:MAG: L-threonylcarbamoyladenylate synthase [Chitinophagales bacterium]